MDTAGRAERRLAAVLAADVAGYSRLMGADEEGTHARLRAHLRGLIEPQTAEHRGRIVKNTGDGFLAEFASVVDAVRCAVEVQRGMVERNAGTPPEQRIEFRIGINLGDVIAERQDIFGDGVNVAARLEALAQPGGICVSRVVRDQIRDKLSYSFEDMGEQSVKNIARPVRVFALCPETIAELPMGSMPIAASCARRQTAASIAVGVVGAVAIAAVAWWVWPATKAASTAPAAVTTSITPHLVAPHMSIVVLPFVNLSKDPDQGYFADGITEDVTTDLSRISGMFVIARNTAFTYQNKAVDARQIGRELGVRYVLEGSVQRSGDRVRITAQLIDAETDAHLWAERFDRDTGDLFAVQNEITSRIAIALNVELVAAEAARSTGNPNALDYIFKARALSNARATPERYAKQIELLERALVLDPGSADAKGWLASTYIARTLDQMSVSVAGDLARAEKLIEQASASSTQNPLAHYAKGKLLRATHRCAEAIPEYEAALASNRNWVSAVADIGRCKIYIGPIDEGIALEQQAIRLSPRDPGLAVWYYRIGEAHLLQSRIEEAIVWLEKARSAAPNYGFIHRWLASAYGLRGDSDRAVAEIGEARRLTADGSPTSIAQVKGNIGRSIGSTAVQGFETVYLAGLRKAGLPEE